MNLPATNAEVTDKVHTKRGIKITDQEAEEMIQSFEDIFGDEDKFTKFRLRQTMIKPGNENYDAVTNARRQAGLPEGTQYEGKVKNIVYAVCHAQLEKEIEQFVFENELHKVIVDGEPEPTQRWWKLTSSSIQN